MVVTTRVGRGSVGGDLRRAISRGLTVTLPILITLVGFFVLVDFVADIALPVLLGLVVVVGTLAESDSGRGGLEKGLENATTNVPALGATDTSVDELGTMRIDSDTVAPTLTGSFLVKLPPERVSDVDFTAEAAVQTIRSTGVTLEAGQVGVLEQQVDGEFVADEAGDVVAATETELGEVAAGDGDRDRGPAESSGPVSGG